MYPSTDVIEYQIYPFLSLPKLYQLYLRRFPGAESALKKRLSTLSLDELVDLWQKSHNQLIIPYLDKAAAKYSYTDLLTVWSSSRAQPLLPVLATKMEEHPDEAIHDILDLDDPELLPYAPSFDEEELLAQALEQVKWKIAIYLVEKYGPQLLCEVEDYQGRYRFNLLPSRLVSGSAKLTQMFRQYPTYIPCLIRGASPSDIVGVLSRIGFVTEPVLREIHDPSLRDYLAKELPLRGEFPGFPM
jgi:hypothetical protein